MMPKIREPVLLLCCIAGIVLAALNYWTAMAILGWCTLLVVFLHERESNDPKEPDPAQYNATIHVFNYNEELTPEELDDFHRRLMDLVLERAGRSGRRQNRNPS